ncbi:hypothetical protein BB170200_03111 [Mycobacterium marinum]|nr:hypothetical protein BB170200_03111 [Mycobacterium marinum]
MAGTRECNSVVTAGRLSKAVEFFDAAEHLEDEMPNAAGDLFVDAGIAASDVICCVRLGVHSSGGTHSEAITLLRTADSGSEKYLSTLLGLKNKAAYTPRSIHRRVQEDEPRCFPSSRDSQTGHRVSKPQT